MPSHLLRKRYALYLFTIINTGRNLKIPSVSAVWVRRKWRVLWELVSASTIDFLLYIWRLYQSVHKPKTVSFSWIWTLKKNLGQLFYCSPHKTLLIFKRNLRIKDFSMASIYFGIPASLNSPGIFCLTRCKFTRYLFTWPVFRSRLEQGNWGWWGSLYKDTNIKNFQFPGLLGLLK